MTNKKINRILFGQAFRIIVCMQKSEFERFGFENNNFFFGFLLKEKRNEWNAGEVSLISEFELFRKKVTSSMMVINDQHLMASASVGPGPKLLECLEV